jgi:hypothetical protein
MVCFSVWCKPVPATNFRHKAVVARELWSIAHSYIRYVAPVVATSAPHKVETPIHDSIRELVTWECKEHGMNIMNVLAHPKGKCWALESEFLIWRLEEFYTNFLSKGVVECRHLFQAVDLSKTNKEAIVKQHI